MRYVLCLVATLWMGFAIAQGPTSFSPLVSENPVPNDFVVPSGDKYQEEIKKISCHAHHQAQTDQQKFYLESCFVIDDLLHSGNVLFNDPLSVYLNQVKDVVLESQPKIRDQMRVYAVRSPVVNAFATNNGIILVNMGLVARLKNEAQLAFILAHEISHYTQDHALHLYMDDVSAQREKQNKPVGKDNGEEFITENKYSKELEISADAEGLKTFLKTDYDINEIDGVFDLLKYAHSPITDIPFDTQFFESTYFKFPNEYYLQEIETSYGLNEHNEDSHSTHPSIGKRREQMYDNLKGRTYRKLEDFLVSEQTFNKMKTQCQYELSNLYLREFNYYESIYNSYVLLHQESVMDDAYLKKNIAKALYGLTKFRNKDRNHETEGSFENEDGEIQRLYYFFNHMKNDELNVLALQYAWKLMRTYPKDPEMKKIANDLFQEMVDNHYESETEFYDKDHAEKYAPFNSFSSNHDQRKSDLKKFEREFIKYAFVDIIKDRGFSEAFKVCKRKKDQHLKTALLDQNKTARQIRKETKKKERELFRKGYALGLDKVVVVNPYYMKMDFRKRENQIDYLSSEMSEAQYTNWVQKNADAVGLETQMLSTNLVQTSEADKMNELMYVTEWFNQQLELEDIEMRGFNQDRVIEIADKYGTDHFLWTGIVSGRKKKSIMGFLTFLYLHPAYSAYYLTNPAYESMFFSILVNVRTGEMEMTKMNPLFEKDSESIVNAHLYDTLLQIKKKAK